LGLLFVLLAGHSGYQSCLRVAWSRTGVQFRARPLASSLPSSFLLGWLVCSDLVSCSTFTMSASRIEYSEKYADDMNEYR
jgi:hypothetical protein